MDRKVEEIKYKVLDLINKKKDVKIPKMGFTDYYVQHSSVQPQQKHSWVPGSGSSGRNSAASSSKYDYCPFYDDDDDGGGQKEIVDGGSKDSHRMSDQEILESTEAIYFDSGSNTGLHELKISVGNHITTAHKNQLRTMHAPKQRSMVYVTLREATQKRNRDSLEDEDEFMGFPSIPLATDGAIHTVKS